ncbi:MAG: DUF4157 domain-containing protein [Bacteroidota bacterium]
MSKVHIPRNENRGSQPNVAQAKSMTPPDFSLDASSPVQQKEEATADDGMGGVMQKMEHSMGADFSDVNIHENSSSAKDMGALAYAQGNDVHFAPGQLKPDTQAGQELIGHELAHVVQQREGRVQANNEVAGKPVNDDKGLEAEADQMGAKAAQAKMEDAPTQMKKSGSTGSNAPAQMFRVKENDIDRFPRFNKWVNEELPKSKNDGVITSALQKWGENEGETARNVDADFSPGCGPIIDPYGLKKWDVSFRSNEGSEIIRINRGDVNYYENGEGDFKEPLYKSVLESNVLNGYTMFLDDQDGKDKWGKEGKEMEKEAFGRDIHSTMEARRSARARFGQGVWDVQVIGGNDEMAQRISVFNAGNGNGEYQAKSGTCFSVTSRPRVNWSFRTDYNEAGWTDSSKGWQRSQMLTTSIGKDEFLVRVEYDGDNDREDLQIRVKKSGEAPA